MSANSFCSGGYRTMASPARTATSAELFALTTAPNIGLTTGRNCSALGLTPCPSTLPGHGPTLRSFRPDVRTPRPTETKPSDCEPFNTGCAFPLRSMLKAHRLTARN